MLSYSANIYPINYIIKTIACIYMYTIMDIYMYILCRAIIQHYIMCQYLRPRLRKSLSPRESGRLTPVSCSSSTTPHTRPLIQSLNN